MCIIFLPPDEMMVSISLFKFLFDCKNYFYWKIIMSLSWNKRLGCLLILTKRDRKGRSWLYIESIYRCIQRSFMTFELFLILKVGWFRSSFMRVFVLRYWSWWLSMKRRKNILLARYPSNPLYIHLWITFFPSWTFINMFCIARCPEILRMIGIPGLDSEWVVL